MSGENTIETLWPMERRPTRKVGGFDIRTSRQTLDNEKHTEIVAIDPKDQSIHTACRVIVSDDGRRELYAGFSISGYDVAIPADIDPQETVNRAMKTALREEFSEAKDLSNSLEDAWLRSKTYLQNRWAENEASGLTPDRWAIIPTRPDLGLVLARKKTLMGRNEALVIKKCAQGYDKFRLLAFDRPFRPGENVIAITEGGQSKISGYGGHQRRQFPKSNRTAELDQAIAAFDTHRKGKLIKGYSISTPRSNNAIAIQSDTDFELYFANGKSATISFNAHYEAKARFSLTADMFGLGISVSKKNISFFEPSHWNGVATWTQLDFAIRCFIESLLIGDRPLPLDLLPEKYNAYDPDNRLLKGLNIPQRHRPVAGAILGKPYENKVKWTNHCERKELKKAVERKTAIDLYQSLADGAVLGYVDKDNCVCRKNETKLAVVTRTASASSISKREIIPLRGYIATKRFTVKKLTGLPGLDDPNALRLAHDLTLKGQQRDFIEAAFRLSFILESGAQNPLQSVAPKIDVYPTILEGFDLRLTRASCVTEEGRVSLFALGLFQSDMEKQYLHAFSTGCGFMALQIGNAQHYHVRPAITDAGILWRESHRSVIEQGILEQTDSDPALRERLLDGFTRAWTREIGQSHIGKV